MNVKALQLESVISENLDRLEDLAAKLEMVHKLENEIWKRFKEIKKQDKQRADAFLQDNARDLDWAREQSAQILSDCRSVNEFNQIWESYFAV